MPSSTVARRGGGDVGAVGGERDLRGDGAEVRRSVESRATRASRAACPRRARLHDRRHRVADNEISSAGCDEVRAAVEGFDGSA